MVCAHDSLFLGRRLVESVDALRQRYGHHASTYRGIWSGLTPAFRTACGSGSFFPGHSTTSSRRHAVTLILATCPERSKHWVRPAQGYADYDKCDARYSASHRSLIHPSFDVLPRRLRNCGSNAIAQTTAAKRAAMTSNMASAGTCVRVPASVGSQISPFMPVRL